MIGAALAMIAGAAVIPPTIAQDIDETRAVAEVGDAIWPGFSTAPFAFLLVTEDAEYLLCEPRQPDGFEAAGFDEISACAVQRGPRSWRQPTMLASMAIFGPPEVIVMGSPDATGLTRQGWRRTVLHEHFHQWQATLPDIHARMLALGLSDGDESGMWMITFPFPYESPELGAAYRAAADALLDALAAPEQELTEAVDAYLAKRRAFAEAAGERNWRYYDFQLWKEGVARWTEVAVAKRAGGRWASDADGYWEQELTTLRSGSLSELGRVSVYAFGAAEAALLERLDPDWRGCYRVTLALGDCWASLGIAGQSPEGSIYG